MSRNEDPANLPSPTGVAGDARSWAERAIGERVPCAQHPDVQTYLRCRSCGRAICPRCAVSTPEGARCPRCAGQVGRARGRTTGRVGLARLGRMATGALAGLAVAMVGGALLTLVPFGALRLLPLVVLGFLAGEVSAAVAGRPGGGVFAMVAFTCALIGPLEGQAILGNLFVNQLASNASLSSSAASLGPFGTLALVGGAALAAARAATAES